MFGTLRTFQQDLAKATWTLVTIPHSAYQRILDTANLENHDDSQSLLQSLQGKNFAECVEGILNHWCEQNIKGGFIASWTRVASRETLHFQFQRPKEAVRFKLTWGGE